MLNTAAHSSATHIIPVETLPVRTQPGNRYMPGSFACSGLLSLFRRNKARDRYRYRVEPRTPERLRKPLLCVRLLFYVSYILIIPALNVSIAGDAEEGARG